jgi:hypothetical protein
MALQLQTPSAFGHDPTDPPFSVIDARAPEPVRDESIGADEAGVRQRFHNSSMPEAPALQLTVTERLTEPPSEEARKAAEKPLLARLSRLRLYYRLFKPPPGVEYQYEDLEIEPPADEEIPPSFEDVRGLEQDVESLIVWTLELLADRPREDEPPLAVGVTLDPSINYGDLHGYVAKCTKSAWAYVRATAGGVRLRVYRKGVSVGVTSDWAGGGTSATVGASTSTRATFDAAVRGLQNGSYYYISYGWTRGTGGGC